MRSVALPATGRATLTAATVILVDQVTKLLAFNVASHGDQLNVFFGVTIAQTRNKGIAFGFFAGRPALVLGLMVVALGVLVWFFLRHRDRAVLWLATGLLLGGALGNAIDRVVIGYVRDFVNLPHWPAFNVADMAITFGVLVLVLSAEHDMHHKKDEAEGAGAQSVARLPEAPDGGGD